MRKLQFNDWTITENAHSDYYACNGGYSIHFQAEYKSGVYTKILNVYDIYNKRCYMASRYHFKYINLVQAMGTALLRDGWLWDYKNQRPALESYKIHIRPYYEKCIELQLPLYDDAEFLHNLFN